MSRWVPLGTSLDISNTKVHEWHILQITDTNPKGEGLAHQNRVNPLQWRHNGTMASQITSLIIVYSTVYSGADQRKHQSSASLAFVRGIHRWPVNSPHKWSVTRKMFPFDDVIVLTCGVYMRGDSENTLYVVDWHAQVYTDVFHRHLIHTLIARFMGPTWGPSGADRTQVGPV